MYNLRTDGGGRAEVRYRACLPPPNQTHLYTYTSQYIDTNITNNEEKKGKKREKKEKKARDEEENMGFLIIYLFIYL